MPTSYCYSDHNFLSKTSNGDYDTLHHCLKERYYENAVYVTRIRVLVEILFPLWQRAQHAIQAIQGRYPWTRNDIWTRWSTSPSVFVIQNDINFIGKMNDDVGGGKRLLQSERFNANLTHFSRKFETGSPRQTISRRKRGYKREGCGVGHCVFELASHHKWWNCPVGEAWLRLGTHLRHVTKH